MRKILATAVALLMLAIILSSISCATPNALRDKIGVQLWSENCNRCHNAPSPTDFSDAKWANIGAHMKIRANLTDEEITKIVEFLQASN
ncbi:MAG: cytochrome c [Bacteroidia bacterium]